MLNLGDTQAQHNRTIDEIAGVPAVKGVEVRLFWSQLEPSKGTYDFSRIDGYLKKLKSLPTPKRLVVRVMDRRFGTSNKSGIVPNYLMSDPAYRGGVVPMGAHGEGFVARLWETPVMDRLMALYKAMGVRFDSDPFIEGFSTGESTLSLGNPKQWPAGYTHAALLSQYLRFVDSARQYMPQSNIFFNANYLGGDAMMSTLLQRMYDEGVAACGPNVMPDNLTSSQRVWTGKTGADYRGLLPIANAVEGPDLGGGHGDWTPKQLSDFAYNTLHGSHLFWVVNTWVGDSSQRWKTGILPFLKTNPPVRTTCPSSYGLCTK